MARGPGPYYFRGRPSLTTHNNMITTHIHSRTPGTIIVNNDRMRGGFRPFASSTHRPCPQWLGPATNASVHNLYLM